MDNVASVEIIKSETDLVELVGSYVGIPSALLDTHHFIPVIVRVLINEIPCISIL